MFFENIQNGKESKMNENSKESQFESRVLIDITDVLAVINHLQDNSGRDKPLEVILTIKPRRVGETDYCSVEELRVEKIFVKNEKEILNISKILTEKLFMADIHVVIE